MQWIWPSTETGALCFLFSLNFLRLSLIRETEKSWKLFLAIREKFVFWSRWVSFSCERKYERNSKIESWHAMFSKCWNTRKVFLMFENVFHVCLVRDFKKYWDVMMDLPKRTANSAYFALFFCPVLVCPLTYIILRSPHQVKTKKSVDCRERLSWYFINLLYLEWYLS